MMSASFRLGSVIACAALLVLSGCATAPDDATGAGSAGAGTAGEEGSESTNSNGDPDADGTQDSNGHDKNLTGEACLPGNWFLDNQEFGALMEGTSGGVVDDVAGTVMLTFRADGTTSTAYDEWTHRIAVDTATMVILKNGTDEGQYELNGDGSISLTDTTINSVTQGTMDIGGQQVTQVVKPEPSVFSQATFTCEGDRLTVTADGGTTVMHREH